VAIVVGIDGSVGGASALRWAVDEASLRDAPLLAVHVRAQQAVGITAAAGVVGGEAAARQRAETVLDEVLRSTVPLPGDVGIKRVVRSGHPASALIDEAAAGELLVVGARGAEGFRGLRLGSTAEHCARHSPCPVVVVPVERHPAVGRVLVAVDGSAAAQSALEWAIDEAARRGAELAVLTAYNPYRRGRPFGAEFMDVASPGWERRLRQEAQQILTGALARVTVPTELSVTTDVVAGHPAHVLAEQSAEAELLVVGSRGLGGFAGLLLGSVTRQVLHHATCPVVVVRG
jgi:nucleotide-binding universal stress UspA family protein